MVLWGSEPLLPLITSEQRSQGGLGLSKAQVTNYLMVYVQSKMYCFTATYCLFRLLQASCFPNGFHLFLPKCCSLSGNNSYNASRSASSSCVRPVHLLTDSGRGQHGIAGPHVLRCVRARFRPGDMFRKSMVSSIVYCVDALPQQTVIISYAEPCPIDVVKF